jgi:hypothetical protein
MNIPGFTAEASVYKTTGSYCTANVPMGPRGGSVHPSRLHLPVGQPGIGWNPSCLRLCFERCTGENFQQCQLNCFHQCQERIPFPLPY